MNENEEEFLLHIAAGLDPLTALAALPDEPMAAPPPAQYHGWWWVIVAVIMAACLLARAF
jgi:hypothetical protein